MKINVKDCTESHGQQVPHSRKCTACGNYFITPYKRGRPPTTCGWFKKNSITSILKERVISKISIPIFKECRSVSKLKVGDSVYILAKMLKRVLSKRRYAREYRIVRIVDNIVYIRRKDTSEHRHYDVPVTNVKLLNIKIGTDYLESEEYDERNNG